MPKSIFHGLSFKQRDDHTCYIIKYSVTVLVLHDKWNQELEQTNGAESRKNCTKIVAAHPRPHFTVDERVFMVLKYTETGNLLETIRRFQRQFPNERTPCRQTVMDNYNKFVQYGFSLNKNVGNSGHFCPQTAFETFWLFPEYYRFTVPYTLKPFSHPFIYWKLWSGMWCAPAIFVQFFCFLLHLSVLILGFTYRKELEHYRILDYVKRVIIPLFKW